MCLKYISEQNRHGTSGGRDGERQIVNNEQ